MASYKVTPFLVDYPHYKYTQHQQENVRTTPVYTVAYIFPGMYVLYVVCCYNGIVCDV